MYFSGGTRVTQRFPRQIAPKHSQPSRPPSARCRCGRRARAPFLLTLGAGGWHGHSVGDTHTQNHASSVDFGYCMCAGGARHTSVRLHLSFGKGCLAESCRPRCLCRSPERAPMRRARIARDRCSRPGRRTLLSPICVQRLALGGGGAQLCPGQMRATSA